MSSRTTTKKAPTIVKLGASRQVVIPKKVHDELGLGPGDFLEVEVRDGKVVFTPQALIDRRLAEGLADVSAGRVQGAFKTAGELPRSLREPRKR